MPDWSPVRSFGGFAASALVLTGWMRWLGALLLALFALAATFEDNRFWAVPLPDRFTLENAFFEHLGLVGGFLLVAWVDLQEPRRRSA